MIGTSFAGKTSGGAIIVRDIDKPFCPNCGYVIWLKKCGYCKLGTYVEESEQGC